MQSSLRKPTKSMSADLWITNVFHITCTLHTTTTHRIWRHFLRSGIILFYWNSFDLGETARIPLWGKCCDVQLLCHHIWDWSRICTSTYFPQQMLLESEPVTNNRGSCLNKPVWCFLDHSGDLANEAKLKGTRHWFERCVCACVSVCARFGRGHLLN